jgi:prephenate dehydrogenase
MSDVLVVGCGLIGTSIGLALRGEATVLLQDRDSTNVDIAVARGAGEPWDGFQRVDLVVVATPPRFVAPQLKSLQDRDVARTYTHVASVQSKVQREVEALACELSTIVGSHPLAGRESSGPAAATSDLFVGRPWALCPAPGSSRSAVEAVRWLAVACGASPVELAADRHDAAVALLSHLPQVAARAQARVLGEEQRAREAGDPASASDVTAVLSGPGLVDTTRLAASDAGLWTDILTLNAERVAPVVRGLADSLAALAGALEQHAGADPAGRAATEQVVHAFLVRGNAGRALVPVKRGELSEAFGRVGVSVDDKPGRLASLLAAAGAVGVNVEDVHVEHVPGRPQGVIELLVDRSFVVALRSALEAEGWQVLGG